MFKSFLLICFVADSFRVTPNSKVENRSTQQSNMSAQASMILYRLWCQFRIPALCWWTEARLPVWTTTAPLVLILPALPVTLALPVFNFTLNNYGWTRALLPPSISVLSLTVSLCHTHLSFCLSHSGPLCRPPLIKILLGQVALTLCHFLTYTLKKYPPNVLYIQHSHNISLTSSAFTAMSHSLS